MTTFTTEDRIEASKKGLKVSIASDLHLEGRYLNIEDQEDADVIILAGDILSIRGFVGDDRVYYSKFFDACQRKFKRVLMVCGNHEYYRSDISTALDHFKLILASEKLNIEVLEDEYRDIEGVRFIGSTLWTNLNYRDEHTCKATEACLNDFYLIQNGMDEHYEPKVFTALDSVDRHDHSMNCISKLISESTLPCFVFTHHGISFKSIHERFKDEWPLNYAFNSDLDDFIGMRPKIINWVHGHVHNTFDYNIGTTRVIANPRGYSGENPEPYRFKVIEIG